MNLDRLHGDVSAAEGCKPAAYKDTLGYWTAGVGHLLGPGDWSGQTFSLKQCSEWLEHDLLCAEDEAQQLGEWPYLDADARQNAVVELIFNMGLAHWKQFAHCRYYLQRQDWNNAAAELISSLWAKQVGPHRSGRLASYIRTGEFS